MRCFSVAGGVRGVPVALQIVPAGNTCPLLLLDVLLLLLVVVVLLVVPLLLVDVLLLVAEPPDPLLLEVEVLLLPVPPAPLEDVELDPLPPQATRDCEASGMATRQADRAREGSFTGTFLSDGGPGRRRRAHRRQRRAA